MGASHYASSPEDAASKVLNGGMDVELGGSYFSVYEAGGNDTLIRAVEEGMVRRPAAAHTPASDLNHTIPLSYIRDHGFHSLSTCMPNQGFVGAAWCLVWQVSESRVDESVGRVLLNRMRVGLFDPLETQPYAALGAESINSSATQDLLLDVTLQSLVLLKNHDQLLPLAQGVKLAVIGPHTNTTRDLVRSDASSRLDV